MTEQKPDSAKDILSNGEVDVGVAALQFSDINLPAFKAEVALGGKEYEDYIIHFYPPDSDQATYRYWLDIFPLVLDSVAQEHFNAGPERLKAAYTEEVLSWWLRAYGMATTLDPNGRLLKFFEKLNQQLVDRISE